MRRRRWPPWAATVRDWLRGRGAWTIVRCTTNDPVKSVSNERTFATDVRDAAEIDAVVDMLSAKVGQRLRRKGIAGRTIAIKIRFSDFTTRTVQRSLSAPTDDELVFAPIARELVHSVWTPGVGVRLLGVGASGFDARTEQLDFGVDADSV